METVVIEKKSGDLRALLQQGLLSDVTVRVGGYELAAHRCLLALASEVLREQFTGPCGDAVQDCWSPEVGSAEAWTWIVRWIYGSGEPLPWELFVEVLVLADQFQMGELLAALLKLRLAEKSEILVPQLLGAFACPKILEKVAAQVGDALPLTMLPELLQRLQHAKQLENAAILVKHLPLSPMSIMSLTEPAEEQRSEEDRLRVLALILRARGAQEAFPRCFLDAVRWEHFPAHVLEAAQTGEFQAWQAAVPEATAWPSPEQLNPVMARAMTARCRRLEARLDAPAPQPGLYARLLKKGMHVQVSRSSCYCGGGLAVLDLEKKLLGTNNEANSWIELRCEALIHVQAIGLQHGFDPGLTCCKSFVVEAKQAASDGCWTTLLSYDNRPLTEAFETFPVPQGKQGPFRLFRIRITGPTTDGKQHLFVSWFDVFGTLQSPVAVALRKALAAVASQ